MRSSRCLDTPVTWLVADDVLGVGWVTIVGEGVGEAMGEVVVVGGAMGEGER